MRPKYSVIGDSNSDSNRNRCNSNRSGEVVQQLEIVEAVHS